MQLLKDAIRRKELKFYNNIYLAAYMLIVFKVIISFSNFFSGFKMNTFYDICNWLMIAILGYKMLFCQRYTIKQIIIFALVGSVSLYTDVKLHMFVCLPAFMLVVSTQDVDLKYIIKKIFYIETLLLLVHVIAYPVLFYTGSGLVTFTHRAGDISNIRHDFLLSHANMFSMLVLWTILAYFYAFSERLDIKRIIGSWLVYFFFYQFSDSNSGIMILSAVCMLLLIKQFVGDKIDLFVGFLAKYLYGILSIFFIILMIIFPKLSNSGRAIWLLIDDFFTGRMKFGAFAYDKFGMTLIGQTIYFTGKEFWNGIWFDGIATDNFYMFMAISYGVIYLVLIEFLFWKYSDRTSFIEKIIIIAYSLYTMMEAYVTYFYFCFAVILVGAYIWGEKNEKCMEQKKT